MFLKLMVVILTAAVTSAMLLVIRQQRLDTMHRASLVHRRLTVQETAVWELRHRIASECRPEHLRSIMDALDHRWVPIPAEPPVADRGLQVVDISDPAGPTDQTGG